MKLHKDYTKEIFSFLLNGTTLLSDNPLRFRKNLYKMTKSPKIKTIDYKFEQYKAKYN